MHFSFNHYLFSLFIIALIHSINHSSCHPHRDPLLNIARFSQNENFHHTTALVFRRCKFIMTRALRLSDSNCVHFFFFSPLSPVRPSHLVVVFCWSVTLVWTPRSVVFLIVEFVSLNFSSSNKRISVCLVYLVAGGCCRLRIKF